MLADPASGPTARPLRRGQGPHRRRGRAGAVAGGRHPRRGGGRLRAQRRARDADPRPAQGHRRVRAEPGGDDRRRDRPRGRVDGGLPRRRRPARTAGRTAWPCRSGWTRRRSPGSRRGSSARRGTRRSVRDGARRDGAAGRGHGRRRPALPDDPPGGHRAGPVAARAGRRRPRQRGARRPGRRARRAHLARGRCARSPRRARSSPSTTSTCRATSCRRSRPTARPCCPGSGALRHAQDKLVMRERLAALGVPVPAFTPVATEADVEGFGAPRRLAAGAQGRDRRLRRQGRLGRRATSARPSRCCAAGCGCWPRSTCRCTRELAALVARSPDGQARRVAGRRDGAVRRGLRRGGRPRAGPVARSAAWRRRTSRCGSPTSSAWSA